MTKNKNSCSSKQTVNYFQLIKDYFNKIDNYLNHSSFGKSWTKFKENFELYLKALDIDRTLSPFTIFKRNILILVLGWFINRVVSLYLSLYDNNFMIAILETFSHIGYVFTHPIPSLRTYPFFISLIVMVLLKLHIGYKRLTLKKFRRGVEYGSARWGTKNDIKPFIDPVPENNIILTATESLTMCSRANPPKNSRNKNVLVIGGSGSGKTRFFIKPNLMQMHTSYVVTDPKGTLVLECGKMLKDNNYRVKVFNTVNFKKSLHYNPFVYIHSEQDILKMVNTIIINTKGEGEKATEDFWVKAERLYYCALIGYIHETLPESEQNFSSLIDLINLSQTSEEDETAKNVVDILFEHLEKGEVYKDVWKNGKKVREQVSASFAVRQYKKYKLAAGKTAKSILISCGARLAPFDIAELRNIMSYDELELNTYGDANQKTALFIIISDTDTTFNFVVSILYSQMFNLLCSKADDEYGGRLPTHVRCLLDEFANIGQIPNFDKLISTIRSREISATVVLQSKAQLKALYKDNAETIEGNCDTKLFLGGTEKTTLKDLSEVLGKETIDLVNESDTRSNNSSFAFNYNKTGKELMSQDELAVMDGGKCILQLRGIRPFLSDKYDITSHKNYKLLSDYDKKNEFNIEKELEHLAYDDSEIYDATIGTI